MPPELDKVMRARRRLEAARLAFAEAMAEAERQGSSQRAIGRAAGLSQAEVWRILRRGRNLS